MAKSDDLKWKKEQYKKALRKVRDTASTLSGAISSLKTVSTLQSASYKVNDVVCGGSFLSDLLDKENSVYSNIVNSVVPSIESKIRSLEDEIVAAELEEGAK